MAGVPVIPSTGKFDPVEAVFRPDALGSMVRLHGWVQRSRSSGGIMFLVLRDRTGIVQVTAKSDVIGSERFDQVEHVQVEGAIAVTGTVAEDRRAPGGREVRVTDVNIIDPGLPFPIFQEQTEEFRLDKRHL